MLKHHVGHGVSDIEILQVGEMESLTREAANRQSVVEDDIEVIVRTLQTLARTILAGHDSH